MMKTREEMLNYMTKTLLSETIQKKKEKEALSRISSGGRERDKNKDSLRKPNMFMSLTNSSYFAAPLNVIFQKSSNQIPAFLEGSFQFLEEKENIVTEGLFRISPGHSELQQLSDRIEKGIMQYINNKE